MRKIKIREMKDFCNEGISKASVHTRYLYDSTMEKDNNYKYGFWIGYKMAMTDVRKIIDDHSEPYE